MAQIKLVQAALLLWNSQTAICVWHTETIQVDMQNPETIQVDMQNPETKLASIPDEPDDELRLNLALYLATQLREINCIVHRKHAHYNKLK